MAITVSDVRSMVQTQSVSDTDISNVLVYAKRDFEVRTQTNYDDSDEKHNLAVLYITISMLFPEEKYYIERAESVIADIIEDSTGEPSCAYINHTGSTTWNDLV